MPGASPDGDPQLVLRLRASQDEATGEAIARIARMLLASGRPVVLRVDADEFEDARAARERLAALAGRRVLRAGAPRRAVEGEEEGTFVVRLRPEQLPRVAGVESGTDWPSWSALADGAEELIGRVPVEVARRCAMSVGLSLHAFDGWRGHDQAWCLDDWGRFAARRKRPESNAGLRKTVLVDTKGHERITEYNFGQMRGFLRQGYSLAVECLAIGSGAVEEASEVLLRWAERLEAWAEVERAPTPKEVGHMNLSVRLDMILRPKA